MTMTTHAKPSTKYELTDWFTNQHEVSTNAERRQDESEKTRQDCRFVKNETDSKTKWSMYGTNNRLSDRIDAFRKWLDTMEKTKRDLDEEVEGLNIIKEDAERKLAELNLNIDVNTECVVSRDSRREVDNVKDDPEFELQREAFVIDKVKANLQNRIDECFTQLNNLQAARHGIIDHINKKSESLDIDIETYNRNEKSSNTYIPKPQRKLKTALTPQEWEDLSRYNLDRAKDEIDTSQRLREATHHELHKTDGELDAQKDAADFALRKRIHELERAKDELDWQKKKLDQEMDDLNKELHGVEEAIKAKIPLIKNAETRLEKRHWRPEGEQCADAAQCAMEDEIQQLHESKAILEQKQAKGRDALDKLQKEMYRVRSDLARKENSLMLDGACVDIRKRLETEPMTRKPCNLMREGFIKEKSKIIF